MKIKTKILLAISGIILITALIYSISAYQEEKKILLSGIDEKLYTAAYMLKFILPGDYHDRIDKDSFTPQEYENIIVNRNNLLCRQLNLQYLWSCMLIDGQIVFTTSTSPSLGRSKQDYAKLFEVHSDPHAFDPVFRTRKLTYSSFHNEWGDGRMVLVPFLNAKGNLYCFGASVSIEQVMAVLQKTSQKHLIMFISVLLIGIIISILITYSFSTAIDKLLKGINIVSSGNLDFRVATRSKDEIGQLSRAFDMMTESLQRSRKEIDLFYGSLEKEISNRTSELQLTRKELELKVEELKRSQMTMLHMVEDLNQQARELRKAQNELVRSERLAAIGEMAGMVSHELRNPLGVIRNSVYFLKMKLGDALKGEKIKQHLDIIEEEVAISDSIITNILAFGKLKNPALSKESLPKIINELLKKIKLPRNIELKLESLSNLPEPFIDKEQVSSVFYNLILNAIQAMPDGGRLTIKGGQKDGYIEISVIDTGEGISEENLIRIFEPLFTTRTKGTGLGLSLCKRIIESHKGTISVESKVGKGSKFTVNLPVSL